MVLVSPLVIRQSSQYSPEISENAILLLAKYFTTVNNLSKSSLQCSFFFFDFLLDTLINCLILLQPHLEFHPLAHTHNVIMTGFMLAQPYSSIIPIQKSNAC